MEQGDTVQEDGLQGDCAAMRQVVERVGDRWSLIVMTVLTPGPVRYNPLLRRIPGISRRMLTFTLRKLERDGLVVRTVVPSVPPQVDYALSPLGRSLYAAMQGVLDWAVERAPELDAARTHFDAGPDAAAVAGSGAIARAGNGD